MTVSSIYYLVLFLFFMIALVFLLNAFIVPNQKYTRLSFGVVGVGSLNLFLFYIGRGIGLIAGPPELVTEVFRWSLVILGAGLLSVGGVPLLEEIRKRQRK